jgi:hypothetical protein
VNREIVHFGDGEFGVLSFDELYESTSFASRNLAVSNFSEMLEETLYSAEMRVGFMRGSLEE